MGGSILGSEAIYNFLNFKIKKKVKFINNLDKNYLVKLKKQFSKKIYLFSFQSQVILLRH